MCHLQTEARCFRQHLDKIESHLKSIENNRSRRCYKAFLMLLPEAFVELFASPIAGVGVRAFRCSRLAGFVLSFEGLSLREWIPSPSATCTWPPRTLTP